MTRLYISRIAVHSRDWICLGDEIMYGLRNNCLIGVHSASEALVMLSYFASCMMCAVHVMFLFGTAHISDQFGLHVGVTIIYAFQSGEQELKNQLLLQNNSKQPVKPPGSVKLSANTVKKDASISTISCDNCCI